MGSHAADTLQVGDVFAGVPDSRIVRAVRAATTYFEPAATTVVTVYEAPFGRYNLIFPNAQNVALSNR